MRFAIFVHSRRGSTSYVVEAREVTEKLRHIGLEWKTSDWPHDQAVTIVVQPMPPPADRSKLDDPELREQAAQENSQLPKSAPEEAA